MLYPGLWGLKPFPTQWSQKYGQKRADTRVSLWPKKLPWCWRLERGWERETAEQQQKALLIYLLRKAPKVPSDYTELQEILGNITYILGDQISQRKLTFIWKKKIRRLGGKSSLDHEILLY